MKSITEKLRFLDNIPKGEDLFEGKSQEKIAHVIVDIIQSSSFKVVGIEGGWGTGKSNLIKIIEKKLLNHNFFIYDVWGHQEDDQRKAILVELTDYISNSDKNIVSNRHEWQNKLKRLLAKEKEVITVNTPYLSVGFIFSLLSIIYIPTVNVFKEEIKDIPGALGTLWKLLLVAFPLFIVLGIYIYNLIQFWAKKSGFLKSFKLAAQDTFQVYTNKQKEESKVEIISDNEPSVKDFRKWMNDIDNDLKNKKLIIVFDNFDRLPKKQILGIWSSIHIFFAEESYKNIKVIIPFDRSHINNAFKELNGTDTNFASDYINKTFDLVYKVSPPILSDWKKFFKKLWLEAGLSTDEKEINAAEQILETFKPIITPREIITFINDIVSNKLINPIIPERYIAIFVLKSEEILKDPLSAITNSSFLLGLSYKYADDENFQRYITALSYQINPENSLEIAYRKQLKAALVNDDSKVLSEISRTNIFSEILFPVLDELENYENPILCLNTIVDSALIDEKRIEVLWENLFLKSKSISFPKFELPEYQLVLAKRIPQPLKKAQYKLILDKLVNNSQPFKSIVYADIIDELSSLSSNNSIEIQVIDILPEIIASPESFVELVQSRKHEYSKYKIICESKDLDNYLVEIKYSNLSEYDFLEYLKADFTLPKFKEEIIGNIDIIRNDPDRLGSYLKILQFVSHESVTIPLTDSDIYEYLTGSYFGQIAVHSASMWIARGSNFSSSYPIQQRVKDALHKTLILEVSKAVELYVDFDNFLIDSIKVVENEFYREIVKSVLNWDNPYRKLDLDKILLNFQEICISNELDPQDLIHALDQHFSEDVDMSINKYSAFYYSESIDNSTSLARESCHRIQEFYDNLDKNEWFEIFINLSSRDLEILRVIKYTRWSSYATNALKEYVLYIISNYDSNQKDTIGSLIQNFEDAGIELTNSFKNVRDELILKRNITPDIFVLFSKWLMSPSIWKDRADDVTRTIIVPSLLDNEISFSTLNVYRSQLRELIASSTPEAFADFLSAVRDRSSINDQFAEFARYLGIQKGSSE